MAIFPHHPNQVLSFGEDLGEATTNQQGIFPHHPNLKSSPLERI